MLLFRRLAIRHRRPLLSIQNLIQLTSCGINNLPEIVVKRVITQAEVDSFATLTGDTNYIHSAECPAERRCVHGAFLNAIVAGIIGTQLPGPGSVVVQQDFTFPQKCVTNEEITITVRLLENRRIKQIAYECRQNDLSVFNGTAKIIVKNVE